MTAPIDIYYDFRSPYAYLAWWRIRRQQALSSWKWRWKPVSIDVLLNLQAGREPLALYVDPLPPPKRKHFLADVRRSANFLRRTIVTTASASSRSRAGLVRRASAHARRHSSRSVYRHDLRSDVAASQ